MISKLTTPIKKYWQKTQDGHKKTTVGWLIEVDKADFIWEEPRPFSRHVNQAHSAKAVQRCPAIVDLESRIFEVPCPVDINIGLTKDEHNRFVLTNLSGEMSAVSKPKLNQMLHLMPQNRWRYPDKPVIQVSAPYRFLSDDPVYMEQLPPFMHYFKNPRPGVMIGGRLPIDVWPRIMQWAFEWHDTSKPLQLKRGEPWFYVRFETASLNDRIKLIEAELTPELKEYFHGMDGVASYMNKTFSLFKTASKRRPKQLLVPKKR